MFKTMSSLLLTFLSMTCGLLSGFFFFSSLKEGYTILAWGCLIFMFLIFIFLLKLFRLMNPGPLLIRNSLSPQFRFKRAAVQLICIAAAIISAIVIGQTCNTLGAILTYVFFAVLYFVLSKLYLQNKELGSKTKTYSVVD